MAKFDHGTPGRQPTQVGSNGFVNRRSTVQSRPPAQGSENRVIKEEWRPIPGLDGWYEASSAGRIRETAKHSRSGKARIVRAAGDVPTVALRVVGQVQRREVRRLVGAAFIGERPGMTIGHIDGDARNCAAANLRHVDVEWPDLAGRVRRAVADARRAFARSVGARRRAGLLLVAS